MLFGFKTAHSATCEAQIPAQCYYIDPNAGLDTNPGTFASPWKSFANINSYHTSAYAPAGWVLLNPGDYVYLMNGNHQTILYSGDGSGAMGGDAIIGYFQGKNASVQNPFTLKNYPGHQPILDPQGLGMGLYLLQSSGWHIEGITIRNAYGSGISLEEADQATIHNVAVYDTDGADNHNMAGLKGTRVTNVKISNSSFYDNYDRTNADSGGQATHNSSNMVFFGGGNVSVHDSLFYQSLPLSDPKGGACLKYKHGSSDPTAYFNVYRNTFKNCKFYATSTGTGNTHFHHNVIIGGQSGFTSEDNGGITHQINQIVEYNTFYGASNSMFSVKPTISYRNPSFPDDPKNIVFRGNIVYDTSLTYNQERGSIVIGNYMDDTLFNIIEPELTFENNCYYNPNLPNQFNIGAYNGGTSGTLGGNYSLNQWQNIYGYDVNSRMEDPLFIDAANENFYFQTGSPCTGLGAYGTPPLIPSAPTRLRIR